MSISSKYLIDKATLIRKISEWKDTINLTFAYKISDAELNGNLFNIINCNPNYIHFYYIIDYVNNEETVKSYKHVKIQEFFKQHGRRYSVFFIDELIDDNFDHSRVFVHNLTESKKNFIYNQIKYLYDNQYVFYRDGEFLNDYMYREMKSKERVRQFILDNDIEYPKMGTVRIIRYKKENPKVIEAAMTLSPSHTRRKYNYDWSILNYTNSKQNTSYPEDAAFEPLLDYFTSNHKVNSITYKVPKRYPNFEFEEYLGERDLPAKYKFEYSHTTNPVKHHIYSKINNERLYSFHEIFYRIDDLFYKKYKNDRNNNKYIVGMNTKYSKFSYINNIKFHVFDLGYDVYVYKK